MTLRPQTLVVAIQCLATQTRKIEKEIEHDESSLAADLEELLVGYDQAAQDLKAAYAELVQQYDGLPNYESLVVADHD